ncbi:hypothetical protein B9G54_02870 [Alloscardovia macacae]|uniref:Primosomal protein N' 3' DNA-binding domain-containing protein n=1 Tax=Alloscardovia macacae TaxID=1160091 RepID=A0A1Y2T0A4_9BIFI|nr:hypothetical protein [Alloscardovia macacae]OTA26988.1 hypothetical protein B9G54_02870 [Alloscardovia macacae]OTA30024.1 hypothetical protein B9T39_01280 [Alloscardovia macacae]
MNEESAHAQQPALDGLAVRKRASSRSAAAKARDAKAAAELAPAAHQPIARVVLDIQTPHLGRLFDYIVPEKWAKLAQPGALIRTRFGGQRVSGIIWERTDESSAPHSSLRPLERVLTTVPLVGEHMRAEIDAIAQYFGGSSANIVRLAVPPRVAKVEGELADSDRPQVHADSAAFGTLTALYANMSELNRALTIHTVSAHVVWDTLAGFTDGLVQWQYDLTWLARAALDQDRPSVFILPDMRHVTQLAEALRRSGCRELSRDAATGQWQGDFVVLNASLPAADRYRAYYAVSQGKARCVLGTRAAMYAPVGPRAVYVSYHDHVYQNWDGFTPYPNVWDVLKLRAERSRGIVVNAGYVRSRMSQWQMDAHEKTTIEVHALPAVAAERSAWVRHLNREELERLADPAVGARVPSTAVRALRSAVERGPVLLSIPARSQSAVLCCGTCRKLAACRRCLGPLMPAGAAASAQVSPAAPGQRAPQRTPQRSREQHAVCQWCATPTSSATWTCRHCGGSTMRLLHVGTEGTAQELAGLIQGVPIVISTPHQGRGVVDWIPNKPAVVIATPGAEPVVRAAGGDAAGRANGSSQHAGYQTVAIIDAWTSLYGSALDQRIDTLTSWAEAGALCVPRREGGQVLILGEAERSVAQSLLLQDTRVLARKELSDARETGLPPVVSAALVWGEKNSVLQAVSAVEADFGGLPAIQTPDGELPSVLGPVPKSIPQTMRQQYMEGMYQRVQCVIRVQHADLPRLVRSLRDAQARHTAAKGSEELHFHVHPKNLI